MANTHHQLLDTRGSNPTCCVPLCQHTLVRHPGRSFVLSMLEHSSSRYCKYYCGCKVQANSSTLPQSKSGGPWIVVLLQGLRGFAFVAQQQSFLSTLGCIACIRPQAGKLQARRRRRTSVFVTGPALRGEGKGGIWDRVLEPRPPLPRHPWPCRGSGAQKLWWCAAYLA